jgi:hypothetical protein
MSLAPWQRLLHRAVTGLDRLRLAGQQVPDWVLGGGTGLMTHAVLVLRRSVGSNAAARLTSTTFDYLDNGAEGSVEIKTQDRGPVARAPPA